jgi:hypothetical protein
VTPDELDAPLDELEELDELEDVELPDDDPDFTESGSWKMLLLEPPQPARRLTRTPAPTAQARRVIISLLTDMASP